MSEDQCRAIVFVCGLAVGLMLAYSGHVIVTHVFGLMN